MLHDIQESKLSLNSNSAVSSSLISILDSDMSNAMNTITKHRRTDADYQDDPSANK